LRIVGGLNRRVRRKAIQLQPALDEAAGIIELADRRGPQIEQRQHSKVIGGILDDRNGPAVTTDIPSFPKVRFISRRAGSRRDLPVANQNRLDVAAESSCLKTPCVDLRIHRKGKQCSDKQTEGAAHITCIGSSKQWHAM